MQTFTLCSFQFHPLIVLKGHIMAPRRPAKTKPAVAEAPTPAVNEALIEESAEAQAQITYEETVDALDTEVHESVSDQGVLEDDEAPAEFEDADEVPAMRARRGKYDDVVFAAVQSLNSGGSGIKVLRSSKDISVGAAVQSITSRYSKMIFIDEATGAGSIQVKAKSRTDPITGLVNVYVQAVYAANAADDSGQV